MQKERFEQVPIERLVESKLNPRKTFDPGKLKELAASIRGKGVVEPLIVRAGQGEHFEVICGARRLRASRLAALAELPVVVREYSDAQAVEVMAIENGQRDDVAPLDEARGYKQLLLVDQTYTPAAIAERIGHTERYVWDRMRLLELVEEAQALLSSGVIGVEHAEVLAKLKAADQRRAISRHSGGLFEADNALDFEPSPRVGTGAYDRFKPVSVRQLRQWIARHVRLDIKHAAAAAPLEFGETAQRVDAALAEPGRGKKVVPIVFDYVCPDGARDSEERTYGESSWKRAENAAGKPTCDHAVLGLVVAGKQQGRSFHVCIARDRCRVHWKDVVVAREKAAALRAKGQTTRAAKTEKKAADREQQRWQREEAERRAKAKAFDDLKPKLRKAIGDKLSAMKKQMPQRVLDGALRGMGIRRVKPADLPVAIVEAYSARIFDRAHGYCDRPMLVAWAAVLGIDVRTLEPKADPEPVAKSAPSKVNKAGQKKSKAA